MGENKELKDLKTESLEQRVAPILVYQEPLPEEDPLGGGGTSTGGGGTTTTPAPDQPGNSDDNRERLWHQNQE